jgi:predicted ferric reductase
LLTAAPPTSRNEQREADATRHRRSNAAWNVRVLVAANAVLVVALWFRHGGLATSSGPGGALIAVGQITGLVGAYSVLLQLVLMARVPVLERYLGFDRLAWWHRWNGFASVTLILTHAVAITLGYAASGQISIVQQVNDFVSHYPDVLMSIVATALLVVVAATSIRAARARLTREAWYFVHVYAYLAVALGFAHQIAVGSDFDADPVARAWWIALYVATASTILVWRVGWPLWFNTRHRLRVAKVASENRETVSVYLEGRALERMTAQAGQFFLWRFLTRDSWWQAHPFSLSAAPDGRSLRITVKGLGDFSSRVRELRPGTHVFAEGPYGAFTAERRTRRRVLLIAGGIGITPLRALLETLPGDPGDITLLYRVEHARDFVFRHELDELARARGVIIHPLAGVEIGDDDTDRLGIPALNAMVPDILERDVYVCGPPGLVDVVHRRLRRIGVPARQIHQERFAY